MVFAPAIAIACIQVLVYLFLFVAAIALAVVARQVVAPNPDVETMRLLLVASVFALLALGSFAALRVLRRAADKR